jgi:hypothetical protein
MKSSWPRSSFRSWSLCAGRWRSSRRSRRKGSGIFEARLKPRCYPSASALFALGARYGR